MKHTGFLILPFITLTPVMALNIKLDFLHDEHADRFFATNPQARSAVEKAAKNLGDILTNSLHQINKDIYSGSNGGTTASFDWSWTYLDPVTGATQVITNPSIEADTIVIYVGTRAMTDHSLGRGGAGGAIVQLTGAGIPTEWIGAVDAAEASSNTSMRRGAGPLINTISGVANYAGYEGKYDLEYGISVGNLWFDADTNNDGKRDSDTILSDFWHYDADTPVAAGKTDLYSVALHEIMHVLGAGTSQTWNAKTDNQNRLGSDSISLAASSKLIADDGYHPFDSLVSQRVNDGLDQSSALSLGIVPGERKELTALDLAFLRDLGFDTLDVVPEPSALLLLCFASLAGVWKKTR
ncbi:MAG: hypothetical protein H7A51_03475 [Akkermansiaceae bacterium]|nr:hypothetical protein [Akkermansiaceae bacterium]